MAAEDSRRYILELIPPAKRGILAGQHPLGDPPTMTTQRDRWLAINHAATIFVSAFLLFQVQPLISKYILPWFGGSPAVWTTCMLFFQSLLFGGYAYAHFSQQWLKPRQQALVHLALIGLTICFLSVIPDDSWKPQDSTEPVGRILGLLAATVGLPYFVLSSTGPLIQAWFARSFPGRTPYRLYALSNVGSLLALLSYPFLFERIFDVPQQATFWTWGFVLYAVLCAYAAVTLWTMFKREATPDERRPHPDPLPEEEGAGAPSPVEEEANAPRWWRRALWLVLPAFASVVLLATTNHVCSDVAVMPFLWVVPLSLYLLTFIIAFDHPRWYLPTVMAAFTAFMIYLVAAVYDGGLTKLELYEAGTAGKIARQVAWAANGFEGQAAALNSPQLRVNFLIYVAWNFAAMFGICMLCHGELVRLRPHPRYLTAFYLMISAGGALGGVAVTLLAPRVFVTFFEFNLSLLVGYVFAMLLIMRAVARRAVNRRVAMAASMLWIIPLLALPTLVIGGVGLGDLLGYLKGGRTVELRVRNFFGTLSVNEVNKDEPKLREYRLYHGGITHGVQFADPDRRYQPTTYYTPESGVGRAIGYYRQKLDDAGVRLGAVGLGTGTLAAYVDDKDLIRFYEINPAVIEIAEPGRWFTYLKDSRARGGQYDIVLGDARLTLERELKQGQPQGYYVLALDAFSGDAIPVHLLTKESFEVYLKHLASADSGEEGAIAIHITNRYVDLEPVVRGLAEHFGLGCVLIQTDKDDSVTYRSDWMIVSRNQKLLDTLAEAAAPSEDKPKPAILWTDGRNNLFDVLN